ncbi:MAG: transcription-repair coupling factor [Actinomycetota bacterium]
MKQLLRLWEKTDLLEQILAEGAAGVPEVARAFTVAGLASKQPVTLVILPRSRDAERFAEELRVWVSGEVHLFPAWEVLPGESLSPTLETMGKRIGVLQLLAGVTAASRDPKPTIVVTSVRGLLQKMADPPADLIRLAVGQILPLDELLEKLSDFGFERTYLVERPGEFAVRGGIVDIFPAELLQPIRVDFLGDEIGDLREFAVSSQRSSQRLSMVEVGPCRELRLSAGVMDRAREAHESFAGDQAQAEDLEKLATGVAFPGMEAYLALLAGPLKPLTRFLPADALVVVAGPKQCRDRAEDFLEQAQHWAGDFSGGMFGDFDQATDGSPSVELWPYSRGGEGIDLDITGWEGHLGKPGDLVKALKGVPGKATIAVAAGRSASRARDVLADAGMSLPIEEANPYHSAIVESASLRSGFLLRFDSESALALVGEADLFGKRRIAAATKGAPQTPARATALLLQLVPGDYVVHETYGVGRYHGMITREVAGINRDYLLISYHGDDRLYLPTEQLAAITRYTGGEAPKLNRLGSGEWEKSKARARKAVEDIAGELTVLYSARLNAEGHTFSPDTPWQAELENAFVHVETPDQLRAIEEVKADMEKPAPMDRLICGDVGYGKTEVAVRAAFKAVQDSMQVAVLVPTTILAQQHHQTFSERFASFPIKVAQLSRFLSATEQKKILEEAATGKVDVLIGTHRLLQPDVKFEDLGLLIVDEEQRFGVKHKEKIKHLREHVDVLTMTATPIPRTLEMGITGIRDLSLMDTPPVDRRPVLTYVGEADSRMVSAAIRRELARDGQVFYVHNRVSSIAGAARRIAGLVPGARVEVAHGQMNEHELEAVMLNVWDGKIDVLVCTTIIESGLDIPAMNTLIVERADRLGLSQLYQLRGRVGRARERAYAYFLYPHDAVLGDEAHERLKTLSEFTELGSGFKIALRDLEIRGAGNLLGAEQSGHIAAVGFDLYLKMMSEAVGKLSGKAPEEKLEVRLDIPADAFVPSSYIGRESLRIEAYRQIEKIRSADDSSALREELTDRFGPLPGSVENLIVVAELRALLASHGINEAILRDGSLKLKPMPTLSESQELMIRARFPRSIYKAASQTLLLPAPSTDVPAWALEVLTNNL